MKVENFMNNMKNRMEKIFKSDLINIWEDVKKCIEMLPDNWDINEHEALLINYKTGKVYNVAYWNLMSWIDSTEEYDYCGDKLDVNLNKNVTVFDYDHEVEEVFFGCTNKPKVFLKIKSYKHSDLEKNELFLDDMLGYEGIKSKKLKGDDKYVVFKFDLSFFK